MRTKLHRIVATLSLSALPALAGGVYSQTNLVSDIPGLAHVTDPALVNPWGLSASATSPWWVSDAGTGLSTVYNGAGAKQAITVTVPPPAGVTTSSPTGQVFNTTTDFKIGAASTNFIFATEDGTIAARTTGTNVLTEVDNSANGAIYKGLALGNNGTANFLYAANFHSGAIDVFDKNYAPATLAGGFTAPGLPSGYAPFNIQNIGGTLYVTYAVQDAAKEDDVAGSGNGYVVQFDANGNYIRTLIANGPLNSPWGLALAPGNFGLYSGDLLVGNFGDGVINAFNPVTGAFLGSLSDSQGNTIVNDGLWALGFGNGAAAGPANSLYFTAGIAGPSAVEDHGLFGVIVATPEPGTIILFTLGLGAVAVTRRRLNAR